MTRFVKKVIIITFIDHISFILDINKLFKIPSHSSKGFKSGLEDN